MMTGAPLITAPETSFPQSVLYRAAVLGQISIVGVDDPGLRVRPEILRSVRQPALAVIAANAGPGRFPAARVMRAWARVGIVHAIEEREREYVTVAETVQVYRRVLLVETLPSLATLWLSFLREHVPATGWMPGRPLL